jgi:Flp pilus assembly protein TadB
MDIGQLFYGPNVLLALMAAVGVLAMFVSVFALTPSVDMSRKLGGAERRGPTLQGMLDQANVPLTAGEFTRTAAVLGAATAILGYIGTGTIAGTAVGACVGPLAYYGRLVARRDKTRRDYQEALARVATIARDVIARGGSMEEALRAIAGRGPAAVKEDFRQVQVALDSGMDLESAFGVLGDRRRDPILTMLLDILMIHREFGSKVMDVLDRLTGAARRRANVRKRILSEQAGTRLTAQIVAVAPFALLAAAGLTMGPMIKPYYASAVGEVTVLICAALSAATYMLAMRMGNKPLEVMEGAFVGAQGGRSRGAPASPAQALTAAEVEALRREGGAP